jgi:hypothetical protein
MCLTQGSCFVVRSFSPGLLSLYRGLVLQLQAYMKHHRQIAARRVKDIADLSFPLYSNMLSLTRLLDIDTPSMLHLAAPSVLQLFHISYQLRPLVSSEPLHWGSDDISSLL